MSRFCVSTAILCGLAALASGQIDFDGPGDGPWKLATPESQGLSSSVLQDAADAVDNWVGLRECFIVVKNGFIVHEQYYRGTGPETTRQGYSTTKSMCASLFGIAVQQGWASVDGLVRDGTRNTRQCNPDALFQHVLTMTGTSPNISAPRYSYDTIGTACLDTLQEYIAQNNPDRLSAEAWKHKFYHEVLGLEHMSWGMQGTLQCGASAVTSCRDLARTAQLWLNDGGWAGRAGQVMDAEYARQGRTNVYPDKGKDYGYTLWREDNPLVPVDPVDPNVAHYNGMLAQCAYHSKLHNAVVVSMGSGAACRPIWALARDAVVSDGNRTAGTPGMTPEDTAATAAETKVQLEQMRALWPLLRNSTAARKAGFDLSDAERATFKAVMEMAAAEKAN